MNNETHTHRILVAKSRALAQYYTTLVASYAYYNVLCVRGVGMLDYTLLTAIHVARAGKSEARTMSDTDTALAHGCSQPAICYQYPHLTGLTVRVRCAAVAKLTY